MFVCCGIIEAFVVVGNRVVSIGVFRVVDVRVVVGAVFVIRGGIIEAVAVSAFVLLLLVLLVWSCSCCCWCCVCRLWRNYSVFCCRRHSCCC